MGAPYTVDLRERAVAAFHAGRSRLETATLSRSASLHTAVVAAGSREGQRGGPRAGRSSAVCIGRRARQDYRTDHTTAGSALCTLRAELQSRGVTVSYFAVWNIVDRAGLSVKMAKGQDKVSPRRFVLLTKPGRRRT